MSLLLLVTGLTIGVTAVQDYIDRWLERRRPVRTFDASPDQQEKSNRGGLMSVAAGETRVVLLVDDDEVFRERMAQALRARQINVRTADSCEAALENAKTGPFDLAVLDLRMPGPSGITLIEPLRMLNPEVRIIVLTGYGSMQSAVETVRLGADDYLSKPVNADELMESLFPDEEHAPSETGPATLACAQKEHVARILADCDGNISEAARRLCITRRTLQLKLKRYRRHTV